MTDLLRVLPHFPVGQFARLIPVLEKHAISTSDLLTLEAADIGKRTHLPLLDVKRLCGAVLDALHADLGVANPGPETRVRQPPAESGAEAGPEPDITGRPAPEPDAQHPPASELRNTAASLSAQWQTISTLDPDLDRALGGGIPAGYVTEVTGESGAGKTQFLLSLLLAAQLPPPHGLSRPALYISTEAPLSTRRLAQMLTANPHFQRLPPSQRPSLDNIISTVTPDLESQDHILNFQVPVEVERRGIGLIVLDSVAANYRADTSTSIRTPTPGLRQTQESPLATRSRPPPPNTHHTTDLLEPPSSIPLPSSHPQQTQPPLPTPSTNPHFPQPQPQQTPPTHPALLLDHQQRWFTGWGDDLLVQHALKTPALGLVWTTQVAARIALSRRPAPRRLRGVGVSGWERRMKVVFAAHAGESGPGVSGAVGFEVWMGGLRAVGRGGAVGAGGGGSGGDEVGGEGERGGEGEGEGEGGEEGG
ncbi:hypothetical protein CHGG_07849 [Chaetomium globosum CBS 148.51]|uniref:RecA family profile 1 domain-containing protein n=1 Tax=Chaetomium globosum (strain ATCC 6205 / CBS 148.51 / DSM 1962 / NBRC 6347 / NRRL 1970) TaxID=306901 RepID=Q2GW05_CHAGB|nr:uncharacterized protein CHGG_07849 [Chaetomium globosum CBS 148.51]EAQ86596.1 hypothetical protein CHGG_07849 [Chaetomium globosum CBS 148.51]